MKIIKAALVLVLIGLWPAGKAAGEETAGETAVAEQEGSDRVANYYKKYGVDASQMEKLDAAEFDDKEYQKFLKRGLGKSRKNPSAAPVSWKEMSAAKSNLPLAQETEVGLMVAGRVIKEYPLLENEDTMKYVTFVGRYVAEQSMRPDLTYRFHIIQTNSPAAYSTPGGYVFVSSGLMKLLRSEDELAFVLGHEVAHVARFHGILEVERKATTRRATEAIQELEAMSKEGGNPGEEFDLEAIADEAFKVFIGFRSRAEEFEADILGIDFLVRGGYKKESGHEVLRILKEALGEPEETSEDATHPRFTDRIAAIEKHLKTTAASSKRKMASTQERFEQVRQGVP